MKKLFLFIFIAFSLTAHSQTPFYVDTSGLIGWYSFTGNANDSSGYGNNGTVYGATLTTDRFGNANSAYSFNGSSDYIQVIYPVSLNTQTYSGICISAWCKFNSLPGSQPENIIMIVDSVFNKELAIGYDEVLQKLSGCNGIVGVDCYDYTNSIDTQSAGTWYHVVLNSDFSIPQTSLYINGVLQATSSDTIIKPNLKYINIGNTWNGFWYMNGSIDDIGIWNHALTQCEISQLYLSSISGNIVNQPTNDTVLTGGTATYMISDTDSSTTYQWQQNTGTGFTNLSNAGPYSGAFTKILTINPVVTGMNNYQYRCILVDTTACNDTSLQAGLVVKTDTTTGIAITSINNNNIVISPNPTANSISIASSATIEKVEIMNLLGQVILSEKANKNNLQIDLSNFNNGIYLVKINDSYIKKVIKY